MWPCSLVYSLFAVVPIVCVWGGGVFWILVSWCCSWCPFLFSNHLAEEERAGCFIWAVLWLCVFYVSSSLYSGVVCSLWLHHFLFILTYFNVSYKVVLSIIYHILTQLKYKIQLLIAERIMFGVTRFIETKLIFINIRKTMKNYYFTNFFTLCILIT